MDHGRVFVSRIWRRIFVIPLVALLVLLTADLTNAMRPSGLSAASCAAGIFRGRPDAVAMVERYRESIVAEAQAQDLPAELLGVVIVNHQKYLSSYRRFTDCLGSALGANLSLGLAQVRLSTAAQLDGKSLDQLSAWEYRELRRRLLTAETNIRYAAREMRSLLEQNNRYPGIGAESLIHDPFIMALLMTEYHMGRLHTTATTSRLSANAFNALKLMPDETLDLFSRDASDVLRIRSAIQGYLQHIYCESGIFNAGVCSDWKR